MNTEPNLEPTMEELLENILADKKCTGLRSKFPRFYIWNNNDLYLIGYWGISNLPAGNSHIQDINKEISKILSSLSIKHTIQNIIGHSSDQQNIHDYQLGTKEAVLKSLLRSFEWEVKRGYKSI